MKGRAFLLVAKDNLRGATEAHWRTAASRAYYALFLEARDALERWGFILPVHQPIHVFVRNRFSIPQNSDLKTIGQSLDALSQLRNIADYRVAGPGKFGITWAANDAIAKATIAIDYLDQMEADSQRLASATKSIRVTFP